MSQVRLLINCALVGCACYAHMLSSSMEWLLPSIDSHQADTAWWQASTT
jgi:hypothetical protein